MAQKSPKKIQDRIQQSFFKKYLIGISIVLISATMWIMLYFQPIRSSVSKYSLDVQEWKKKIKIASVSQDEITKFEIIVDTLNAEIRSIEKKIYHVEEIDNIAAELIEFTKKYALKVQSMVPDYAILFPLDEKEGKGKLLVKLPLELKLKGRYISIGKFLDNIVKLPFIFSADEVSIDAQVLMHPMLKIAIKGYLFLLNDQKTKIKQTNDLSKKG